MRLSFNQQKSGWKNGKHIRFFNHFFMIIPLDASIFSLPRDG